MTRAVQDQEKICSTRRPLGEEIYLTEFVTPGTYLVQKRVSSLQSQFRKEMVYQGLDWVCRNIRYRGESGDVWYFPAEAMHMGRGDCEESAFITCSLLRACGLSPDEIFVALGYYGVAGHAWCVLFDQEQYWVLETTLSKAPESIPLQARPYEPYILFNDIRSVELKPGFVVTKTHQKEKHSQIEKFYGIMVG